MFVLVIAGTADIAPVLSRLAASGAACLTAQLPNGVTLRLEGLGCTGTALVGAMITALSAR